jgi:Bacterial RNA polymerase, alpha chain C terminal domain
MPHEAKTLPGPIEGLRLPARAWGALRREGIMNLDQLMTVAYQIDQFSGIGAKTAHVIREELVRVMSLNEQPPNPSSEG